jgi:hypothetical protein
LLPVHITLRPRSKSHDSPKENVAYTATGVRGGAMNQLSHGLNKLINV